MKFHASHHCILLEEECYGFLLKQQSTYWLPTVINLNRIICLNSLLDFVQVVRDPRFESLCGNLDVEG